MVAKVVAHFAVIGIDGNQAGIRGRQEQTTRAGGGLCCRGWRGQGLGVFKITETTAALPVWRGCFGIVTPFLFARIDIQRQHFAVRRTDEQRVANLQRCVLIFGTGAVALWNITGMSNPCDLQLIDILLVDLI